MSISITRGTTNKITAYWRNQDNTRRNITGATVRFVVKVKETDTDAAALLTKQTGGSGITITNASQGEFEVALAAADLVGLVSREKEYPCAFWLTEASGDVSATETTLAVNIAP